MTHSKDKGIYNKNGEIENVNENVENGNSEKQPCWKSVLHKLIQMKIELIILAIFFCISLTETLRTDFILTRTCLTTFGFSKSNCSDDMPTSIRNLVQPYASKIILSRSIIEAIFPAALSLFIGPWTDIYGRKPFLILPGLGIILSYLIWLVISYIHALSPFYFLLASFPESLAGGIVAVKTCSFSYVADTTDVELRAIRMTVIAAFMGLGALLGYAVSVQYTKIFKDYLPLSVFGTSMLIMLINTAFIYFKLPETISNQEMETSILKKITALFNLNHAKQSIRVLIKKRPEHARVMLLLILAFIFLIIVVEQGEQAYLYLVVKGSFSWSLEDFNSFQSNLTVIAVIVGTALMFAKEATKVAEITFMLLIMLMQVVSSFILALAKNAVTFYIGKSLGTYMEIAKALAKTKISFLVPTNELGKIFSTVATLEAVAPLIASPIYTAVYGVVLIQKPLYLFFLSGAVEILMFILLIVIKIIYWKYGLTEHQPKQTESTKL